MFAYAKNVQLAVSDRMRRVGMTAGAGVAVTVGAGFLLAALWTYLDSHLGWGPLGASLAIGVAMLVIGLILMAMARGERHPMPSTDDLKLEVEQQLNLMANNAVAKASDFAEATMQRASTKAAEVIDLAENKVHSVADNLSYRANRMADVAEARAYGTARHLGESAARGLGLASGLPSGEDGSGRARHVAPIIGALAVGLTLAGRLQARRHRDDDIA